MPMPGLDIGAVTPELKLRLKPYCSWTWCVLLLCSFFFPFFCLFIILLQGFFIPIFLLYYQLYHHYLLIPTLIPFTFLPSPVVKSIALLPYYSFCPFSSTLSHCPHLSILFSPNLSPDYPSLLHTHDLLTNLLYQLYTTPTPCNLWHKHPTLQQQKYNQTHIRTTKPSNPHIASPIHPHHLPTPLLVPP
jgi:hypothetical protein